jgi:hypothetical protein
MTVGAITGGLGVFGGGVSSELSIGTLVVNGDITGSSQDEAGKISAGGRIVNLTINGNLVGGAGNFDTTLLAGGPLGQISTEAAIVNLDINGSILGGSGARSGQIYAGSVRTADISGSIVGDAGEGSGALIASRSNLGTVNITGSLMSGRGVGSGVIAAQLNIGSIEIDSIIGSAGRHATISAGGRFLPASQAEALSIASVHVATLMDNADILAGYGIDGTPLNPDARIGEVVIVGKFDSTALRDSNIVAGIVAGNDGQFGTFDDREIGATPGPDDEFGTSDDKTIGSKTIISRIANLVVDGIISSGDYTRVFGVVAQQVVAVRLGGEALLLNPGPANDSFSLDDSNIRLQELGVIFG